jgi:multicomponent Na+:H+ antiporter subunit B
MLLFSVFLLLRGHDEPGGGFVGGLMAVGAFALYAVSHGVKEARRALRLDPRALLGGGLLTATAGGLTGIFGGEPFLTSQSLELILFGAETIKLDSTLVFDIGVYLVVIGATLTVLLALEEI